MIVKTSYIDIDYAELKPLNNKEQIGELIRKRLIEQDKINIDYYNININKITWFEANHFYGQRVFVSYILERKSCWDTLEEVEERLKTGL